MASGDGASLFSSHTVTYYYSRISIRSCEGKLVHLMMIDANREEAQYAQHGVSSTGFEENYERSYY